MKKISIIIIIAVALAAILLNSGGKMEAPRKAEPVAAPKFTLPDVSGKKISLSDFNGKPVMINFWASWCFPCRQEMPEIERAYKLRRDYGLVVLAINLKESQDVIQKYLKKHDFSFQVLMDETGGISEKFQLFGLPTTFFIDKEGVIQYSYMGEMTKEIINMGFKAISVKEY